MGQETDTEQQITAKEFIQKLADEAKSHGATETWYCVAACSFAACNRGDYVADIYRAAINERPDDIDYQKNVLRRIKGKTYLR